MEVEQIKKKEKKAQRHQLKKSRLVKAIYSTVSDDFISVVASGGLSSLITDSNLLATVSGSGL